MMYASHEEKKTLFFLNFNKFIIFYFIQQKQLLLKISEAHFFQSKFIRELSRHIVLSKALLVEFNSLRLLSLLNYKIFSILAR